MLTVVIDFLKNQSIYSKNMCYDKMQVWFN